MIDEIIGVLFDRNDPDSKIYSYSISSWCACEKCISWVLTTVYELSIGKGANSFKAHYCSECIKTCIYSTIVNETISNALNIKADVISNVVLDYVGEIGIYRKMDVVKFIDDNCDHLHRF
jgi:hypothetical protein